MYEAASTIGLYAETPLHPGSGATTGAIDLPVQRERHTGFPLIPASTLKGVLRDSAEGKSRKNGNKFKDQIIETFGPTTGSGDLHGGAFSPTDARLLLFPVRSLQGIFVWVTCPTILRRLARDLALVGEAGGKAVPVPEIQVAADQAVVGEGEDSSLTGTLILEDEDFSVVKSPQVAAKAAPEGTTTASLEVVIDRLIPRVGANPTTDPYTYYRQRLRTHLAVIADTAFSKFVRGATEIVTRIKLNKRKTTTGDGNMWVEEFLPSDCLFYSVLLAMTPRADPERNPSKKHILQNGAAVLDFIQSHIRPSILQVGGNETVGRGWMRVAYPETTGKPAGAKEGSQ
jgi:CRISPR-associated protein Cmr4